MVPCVHGPPSYCTATVDAVDKEELFLSVSTFLLAWCCLSIIAEWFLSLISHPVGGLLNLHRMSLDGQLNMSMAGLGNQRMIGVKFICNKDVYQN